MAAHWRTPASCVQAACEAPRPGAVPCSRSCGYLLGSVAPCFDAALDDLARPGRSVGYRLADRCIDRIAGAVAPLVAAEERDNAVLRCVVCLGGCLAQSSR